MYVTPAQASLVHYDPEQTVVCVTLYIIPARTHERLAKRLDGHVEVDREVDVCVDLDSARTL
jgi:hypothetical protein